MPWSSWLYEKIKSPCWLEQSEQTTMPQTGGNMKKVNDGSWGSGCPSEVLSPQEHCVDTLIRKPSSDKNAYPGINLSTAIRNLRWFLLKGVHLTQLIAYL